MNWSLESFFKWEPVVAESYLGFLGGGYGSQFRKLPIFLFGTKSNGFFGRARGQYYSQGISKTFPQTSSNRVLKKLSNKTELRRDENKMCFFFVYLIIPLII